MLEVMIERQDFLPPVIWEMIEAMPEIESKTFTRASRESDPREMTGLVLVFKGTGRELFVPFWGEQSVKRSDEPVLDLGKARFVVTEGSKFESDFKDDSPTELSVADEGLVIREKNLTPYKPEKYQKLYTLG